jgi:hypothetical protein
MASLCLENWAQTARKTKFDNLSEEKQSSDVATIPGKPNAGSMIGYEETRPARKAQCRAACRIWGNPSSAENPSKGRLYDTEKHSPCGRAAWRVLGHPDAQLLLCCTNRTSRKSQHPTVDRAMAHAVSCLPATVEARVRSRISSCEIYDGQNGTEAGFPLSSFHRCPTLSSSGCYHKYKRVKSVNLKIRHCSLGYRGALHRRVLPHVFVHRSRCVLEGNNDSGKL